MRICRHLPEYRTIGRQGNTAIELSRMDRIWKTGGRNTASRSVLATTYLPPWVTNVINTPTKMSLSHVNPPKIYHIYDGFKTNSHDLETCI